VKRLLAWLPAAAWAGVIFYLSSRPRLPAPDVAGIDKVAHFGAYALLASLLIFATERSRLPLAAAVVLGLLYGVSDELHQMFVPGRAPDVLDWFADAAGVAAATFVYVRRRAGRAAAGAGAPLPSA
jgi:VanZ family protein